MQFIDRKPPLVAVNQQAQVRCFLLGWSVLSDDGVEVIAVKHLSRAVVRWINGWCGHFNSPMVYCSTAVKVENPLPLHGM